MLGPDAEDLGGGYSCVDFGIGDVDACGAEMHGVGIAGEAGTEMADGEHVGFDGASAVHAPVVFGDGLGELDFEGAFGREAFDDGGAEFVVGFAIFVGHQVYLAGKAMAQCVHF